MKFLAVISPPPAIYHSRSTRETFWEDNFTLENMKSCEGRNFMKHREIKNGKQYTILDIYSKLDCLNKREATFS